MNICVKDLDGTVIKTVLCLPPPPTTNGTYILKATVSNGTVTITWVSDT